MSRSPGRAGLALAAALVIVAGALPPSAGAADPVVPGEVVINGGAWATNDPIVTVDTPAQNATQMRVSGNGTAWKLMAYAPSITWDLADPVYGDGAADGWKDVNVQWDDGSDSWTADGGGDTITYDTTPPTESSMQVSFEPGKTVTSGKIVHRITWLNDDHGGIGTERYETELETDGGPGWTPMSSSLPLPGQLYALPAGHSYRVRSRGIDYAGNVSAWLEGPSFGVQAYQESSSRIRWTGTWSKVSSSSFWGGAAKASKVSGSTAKITFTGRMVAIVATVGPTRGAFSVYVNGTRLDTVDLGAPSVHKRRVVWTKWWPTTGSRTVKIKLLKPPGRSLVQLDAFVLGY
jgi:hypothetical protein